MQRMIKLSRKICTYLVEKKNYIARSCRNHESQYEVYTLDTASLRLEHHRISQALNEVHDRNILSNPYQISWMVQYLQFQELPLVPILVPSRLTLSCGLHIWNELHKGNPHGCKKTDRTWHRGSCSKAGMAKLWVKKKKVYRREGEDDVWVLWLVVSLCNSYGQCNYIESKHNLDLKFWPAHKDHMEAKVAEEGKQVKDDDFLDLW